MFVYYLYTVSEFFSTYHSRFIELSFIYHTISPIQSLQFQWLLLSKFTELCNHHHYLTLEDFIPRKRKHVSIVRPILPLSPAPDSCSLLYVCYKDLPVSDISYKHNHTVCVFYDWLLSRSMVFTRLFHVVVCFSISCLFVAEQHSIAWLYHTLKNPFIS